MSNLPTHNSIELLCPFCGYDLRGIESGRCPECGAAVDRATLTRSRIPWEQRRHIGSVRAYWRTVLDGSFHPSRLVNACAGPVSWRDAQRFRFITAAIASVTPVAIQIGVIQYNGGTGAFPIGPMPWNSPVGLGLPPAGLLDSIIPWMTGLLLWPVLPLATLMFLILFSGVASYWFAPRTIARLQQNRALAISLYACAALVWTMVPLALGAALIPLADSGLLSRSMGFTVVGVVGIGGGGLLISNLLLIWVNTLRLLRRCAGAGMLRMLSCAIGLPLAWILCGVVSFGVFPWIVGFIYLMIDSLRH